MPCDPPFDRRPPAAGPGWFESSFDLQRGLVVSEGWSDAAPVDAWLAHRHGFSDAPAVPWRGREAASARTRPSRCG